MQVTDAPQVTHRDERSHAAPSPGSTSTTSGKTWLSLREVAELLGVSKTTIHRLPIPRTHVGRLPRFNRQVVEAFMGERQKVPLHVEVIAPPVIRPTLVRPRPSGRKRNKLDKISLGGHLLKLMLDEGGSNGCV